MQAEIVSASAHSAERIDLGDLRVSHPLQFLQRMVAARPRILVCEIPEIEYSTVILCAPRNKYLASVGFEVFPRASDDLRGDVERRVTDETFHVRFLATMKAAGIMQSTFPVGLFSPYDQWGSYGTRPHGPLGKKFDAFAWGHRISSAFVPNRHLDSAKAYALRQLEDFGPLGFVDAPESIDAIVANPRFSEIPNTSPIRYSSPDYLTFAPTPRLGKDEKDLALARVDLLINRLEAGDRDVVDLFPLHAIRVAPQLFVSPVGTEIDFRIVERRARLLRKLGWPWHYTYASIWLAKSRAAEMEIPDEYRSLFSSTVEQVTAFLREIEDKYPIVGLGLQDQQLAPNL